MRTLAKLLVAMALSCAAVNAAPYQEAGHFFTAYALVATAEPHDKPRARILTALCAQLPDMAADLDATQVYLRLMKGNPVAWTLWGLRDNTRPDVVRKMVTVQQLLHALTGGTATVLQNNVALPLVASLRASAAAASPGTPQQAVAYCAWGFGLHFYGDAFAHDRMDKPGSMYSTGQGHAIHLNYPDYPLCDVLASGIQITEHCKFTGKDDQRFGRWKQIWSDAGEAYDVIGFKEKDPAVRKALFASVATLGPAADDVNDWNEKAMRKKLVPGDDDKRIDKYVDFITSQHSNSSCEKVLADALQQIPELQDFKFQGLTCAAVWKAYSDAARKAFSNPKALGARFDKLDRPLDKIYIDMPLDPAR